MGSDTKELKYPPPRRRSIRAKSGNGINVSIHLDNVPEDEKWRERGGRGGSGAAGRANAERSFD